MEEQLARAASLGVSVDRSYSTPQDFERKGAIISEAMNAMQPDCDVFLPLDCDEFIGLKRPDGSYSCSGEEILELFSSLGPGAYFTIERLRNHPDDMEQFFVWSGNRKLFFVNCPIEGLDVGFHNCKFPKRPKAASLCHFELHHKPFHVLQQHAKNKMRLRVDVEDQKAIAQYEGPGIHLIPFLKMKSELEYLEYIQNQNWFRTSALKAEFEKMEIVRPFDCSKLS